MKITIFGAIGCLSMLSAGAAAQSVPAPASAAGYKRLTFSDDFSRLDLSPDGGGKHRWFNMLWQRPPVSRSLFKQMNGFVRLETSVMPLHIVGTTAITTMPRTNGSATVFQYGYFEARLRYKPGQFNWPAFWLLSQDRPKINDNLGRGRWCEIDIFEGGRPQYFQGTVHDWKDFKSTSNPNQHFRLPPDTDQTRWNTYGMLWTPASITWFFNGQRLGSAPTPKVCQEQRLFLIVGAQKRKFGPNAESIDVDWVHVYR